LRSSNWTATFLLCGIIGVLIGYVLTLLLRPGLLPPMLRFGGLTQPTTVLLLGTDVVYNKERRGMKADQSSYQGRSDTILVCRLDPIRNSLSILSIPRDTEVKIPGHKGMQKINGANAFGGPRLAAETIWNFLNVPIDHYAVLNVHGLVDLVDELGGITVEVPKPMHYKDNSAKLNINLEPGPHLLNGTEAMGFVRFRHDALGDIGRVQRQELFLRAVEEKALDPLSWAKVPKLLSIAQDYVLTDMDTGKLMQLASFVRAVPKANQQMIMLPGNFTGTGDWAVTDEEVQHVVAHLLGQPVQPNTKEAISVTVENATADPENGRKLYKYLSACGYKVVSYRSKSDVFGAPLRKTRIIAQKGNTEEAMLIKQDLLDRGDIVNASVGDIQSAVTVVAGDDVTALMQRPTTDEVNNTAPRRRRGHHH
jgi:polyisoprenyl-teichoic acid--peptidoglycan teichoic acid transferase